MSADPVTAIHAALSVQPVLVCLAGPNGAGKTTFFEEYLAHLGLPFVNADRVARLLRDAEPTGSPDDLDRRAFREAERLRAALVEARLSFCAETVFSDPVGAKLGFLRDARAHGFATFLVFVGLDSPSLSVARVMQRVRQGGHDVADAKLHARFPRTLANLRGALPLVDEVFLFDNSSGDRPYRTVAVYRQGQRVSQHAPIPAWAREVPGLGPNSPAVDR